MKKSTKLRREFIEFFRDRKHTIVPSAPVVPADDPTLLFTNAGMNQFKDVFLEQGTRPYSRAVNSQKCIRVSGKHNDLEIVGTSPSHHTFFEMLGNWSFGDYYKREAIRWAWELVTDVWKIDPAKLYATVFEGNDESARDDDAYQAWVSETTISPEQISFHGRKDNFWEMGDIGPCGPCSEIHIDLGPSFCQKSNNPDHQCVVNGECGRIVELWNLVFIQYRRDDKGKLNQLPRTHVDTGAGFERLLMVIEGVNSNYETSLFTPIIDKIVDLSGVPYHQGTQGIPHRVAADHVRALAFSLSDGVLPSNEGRGYVIRRILRRAARFGREIGLETPFLLKLVDPLVDVMGDYYPDLKERYDHIVGIIRAEEESFSRTLGRGLELFGSVVEKIVNLKTNAISGDDAFKLYDTYGFPLDLTELMARERHLTVDIDRFNDLMDKQRQTARGEGRFVAANADFAGGLKTDFAGYDQYEVKAVVLAVNQIGGFTDIILDRTPFYAEAGGQVSDSGHIITESGRLTIKEVSHTGDMIIHRGNWEGGRKPAVGESVDAGINFKERLPIQYNHTATHLLHTALRQMYGKNTNQAGSLVAPDRLRFDFNHFERPTSEQLAAIERTVNQSIRDDYEVKWYEMPFQEAIDSGITALFGEKYGDTVRVVHIGSDGEPYSRELCGGTHVKRTGQIGLFRIVSEGSVSAGVRRIEAVTGETAVDFTLNESESLELVRELLGSHGSDPVEKLKKTLAEKKNTEKELERMVSAWAKGIGSQLLSSALLIDDVKVITHEFEMEEIERLKIVGDAIRALGKRAVALLTSPSNSGSGHLCCVVSDDLIAEGKLKAGQLVGSAAKFAGGGGGGRPHMATAGTKSPGRLSDAIQEFPNIVKQFLGE